MVVGTALINTFRTEEATHSGIRKNFGHRKNFSVERAGQALELLREVLMSLFLDSSPIRD